MSRPSSWLQSLMSGLTSRPDPAPQPAKLTHVECVEAEYQQHLSFWNTQCQAQPMSQKEYANVVRALEVWRLDRLKIASDRDQQDAEDAAEANDALSR